MTPTVHDRIDAAVLDGRDRLVALRHELHAHPELSNRERRTARRVADELAAVGVDEIRTGIAGHGVVGILRGRDGSGSGGRVAALRADMDALPIAETADVEFASTVVDRDYPGGPFPVAHACGHDCHMAAVLAAAGALVDVRDQLSGTVMFVFQPAEEGPPVGEEGGARAMLDSGAFEDPTPTMVFGMHVAPFPTGTVAYRRGTQFSASRMLRVTVTGEGSHGAAPWLGTDPYPAAAAIITGVAQVHRRTPATRPVAVTFGHLEDTGRFNVIGATVTMWGTVRATDDETMAAVEQLVTEIAEGSAAAHGCGATVDLLQPVPAVHNSDDWIDATLPTLRRVLGDARVVPAPATLVYDDVSEMVNAFGGVYLQYGVQDTALCDGVLTPIPGGRGLVPNHHPAFYADDDALVDSARVHAHVAADHLLGLLEVPR